MIHLEGRGLSKRFGGVQALSEVDVTFAGGEVHGLIGPNGSGKSTLLAILSGAQTPDSGSIGIGGHRTSAFRTPRHARGLGIERIPQELALVPEMTVADNIALGGEPRRWGFLSHRTLLQRVEALIEKVGLAVEPDALAGSLRPSEQRLTMLARALLRSSKIVIADEPTAGLLPSEAANVTSALKSAADEGLGVIFVSHHLEEVARIAQRVTVLRDGHVAARFDSPVGRRALLSEMLSAPVASPARGTSVTANRGAMGITSLSAGYLYDFDLEVRAHEVVGIAGLPGSGREHLLPAIVGEIGRRVGHVEVNGRRIVDPQTGLRAGVGYMNGNRRRAIIGSLDVASHVSLPALSKFARAGVVRRRREAEAVESALARVSVKGSSRRPLTSLSGGNQQRALLARWFAADVSVLLVDEPAVGVDVGARASLLQELRSYADRGAVLIASSDPEDLADVCDRVVCLREGRVSVELDYSPNWLQKIEAAIL